MCVLSVFLMLDVFFGWRHASSSISLRKLHRVIQWKVNRLSRIVRRLGFARSCLKVSVFYLDALGVLDLYGCKSGFRSLRVVLGCHEEVFF